MKYLISGPKGYVKAAGGYFEWTEDLQKARVYNTKSAAVNSYNYNFEGHRQRENGTDVEIVEAILKVELV